MLWQRCESNSLECPIVLIAEGLGATQAVLEELDPAGDCRLRSLRFFSPGTKIQFSFGRNGAAKVQVFGRIAGYTTQGVRFVYEIELDEMVEARLQRVSRLVADGRVEAPLARASVRAEADFDLEYGLRGAWRHARAANLSVGGLLMRAHEVLNAGLAVDLRFTLPTALLNRRADEALEGRSWDRGVREAARAMMTRPFKELQLRGRVVCRRPVAGTIGDYGLEFWQLDVAARGEIERYVSACAFGAARMPTSA